MKRFLPVLCLLVSNIVSAAPIVVSEGDAEKISVAIKLSMDYCNPSETVCLAPIENGRSINVISTIALNKGEDMGGLKVFNGLWNGTIQNGSKPIEMEVSVSRMHSMKSGKSWINISGTVKADSKVLVHVQAHDVNPANKSSFVFFGERIQDDDGKQVRPTAAISFK